MKYADISRFDYASFDYFDEDDYFDENDYIEEEEEQFIRELAQCRSEVIMGGFNTDNLDFDFIN